MGRTAISESEILNAIVVSGAVSRVNLGRLLGLSKAAITKIVNRLIDQNFVTEGQLLQDNKVGRKRVRLSVRDDLAYFLGADIEGLAVRVCVIDCSGKTIGSGKRAIASEWSTERIIKQWLDLIDDVLNASKVPHGKIAGFGIGLPGTVSREQLSTHAYLPPGQWVDFDISDFKRKLGLDMAVWNNVVCISEYERKRGVAVGADNLISILARYGIGASIYSDGSLTVGQELSTGELGHMRIDMRGPKCICGRKGCLDVFASGRTWQPFIDSSEKARTSELKKRGRYIGVAIANMLKLFHLPLIVMNGIYNDYEDIVKPVIEKTLADELEGLKVSVPEVIFGAPVELKTSMGAAIRASETFFRQYLNTRIFGINK